MVHSARPPARAAFAHPARRSFLIGLGAVLGGGLGSAQAGTEPQRWNSAAGPSAQPAPLDALVARIAPLIDIWNVHTGERAALRYYTNGQYDAGALARLNWIMRDWRAGAAEQMDVRLFWALSAIAQAAMQEGHSGVIRLNSGYRTRRTNAALEGAVPNSMHLRARAVDFMLDGMPTEALFAYARWLGLGGVGHYPGRFVHLDSGRVRSWTG